MRNRRFVARLAALLLAGVSAIAAPRAEAQSEGIQVHGNWTVEIREPDGSVVSRHQFHNDLHDITGVQLLADLLSGRRVAGPWAITLSSATPPCFIIFFGSPSPTSCYLTAVGDPSIGPDDASHRFATVEQELTSIADGFFQVHLTGNATAAQDGVISQVGTSNRPCQAFPCTYGDAGGKTDFTHRTLTDQSGAAAEIPVVEGQIIQVDVIISFS